MRTGKPVRERLQDMRREEPSRGEQQSLPLVNKQATVSFLVLEFVEDREKAFLVKLEGCRTRLWLPKDKCAISADRRVVLMPRRQAEMMKIT